MVGQLIREENEELGISGELQPLARLTLCLKKLGRVAQAAEVTASYLERYKYDLRCNKTEKITMRVQKALARSMRNSRVRRVNSNGENVR